MTTLEFFAEMGWKSALIAAAALGFAAILRSRAASDRALVLRIGVAMLLLLPLIAPALPALEIVAFAAPEAPPPIVLTPELIAELAREAPALAPTAPEPTIWDDPTPLVLIAYLAGLMMIGARLFGGLVLLRRWTRAARPVTCPEWLAAFEEARWAASNAEDVRLLVSDRIGSPLSWGWRRPAILIDPDTLDQPQDAAGILAHEMAHIARRDWPVLIAARLVATLFWFNPIVWLLEREVVQQAEEAADLAAAERIEPARYAETLLSWAQANGALPANSIATQGSALGRRVRAILDRRSRERPAGSAWTAFAILACLMVAAPVAAAKLVAAVRAPEAPQAPLAPAAPAALQTPDVPEAPEAPEASEAPEPPETPDMPDIDIDVDVGPEARAAAREAIAAVRAQIPQIVASARAAVNARDVQEALREAEIEMREAGRLSRTEIAAAMRSARIALADANAQVRVVSRVQINAAMQRAREAQREAWRAQVEAQRHVRTSMRHGADGMERGADGMERGADRMEQTAHRLATDPAYRERQIARARERGETVTHEQLIDAAEDMREGAQGMREGARGMREGARRMREGRD
ncbi:M56 family metallopeptidase [Sphingosinicella sp.]|uniref:M56 family metallopeptidase n=1 Tax=Sphingosinicella sp. TaxID=1917971 RepID=UPI0040384B3D